MLFFAYCEQRCEKLKNIIAPSFYRNYKRYVEKFKTFVGHSELYFEDITVTLLNDYVKYCSQVLKNSNTTISYSLNILAIMYKDAIQEDIVTGANYPFTKITVKKDTGTRQFLNAEQLQKLEEYKTKEIGTASIFKDMFIFSVYGGGLRFSDILEIQWKHYNPKSGKITKMINKTRRQHSFKLTGKAVAILNKYKTAFSEPDDFVFPLIKNAEMYHSDRFYKQKETERNNALCGLHDSILSNLILDYLDKVKDGFYRKL